MNQDQSELVANFIHDIPEENLKSRLMRTTRVRCDCSSDALEVEYLFNDAGKIDTWMGGRLCPTCGMTATFSRDIGDSSTQMPIVPCQTHGVDAIRAHITSTRRPNLTSAPTYVADYCTLCEVCLESRSNRVDSNILAAAQGCGIHIPTSKLRFRTVLCTLQERISPCRASHRAQLSTRSEHVPMTEKIPKEAQEAIDKVWYALGPKVHCPCGPDTQEQTECLLALVFEANTALDAIRPFVSAKAKRLYRSSRDQQ